jgi:hypothetical protein
MPNSAAHTPGGFGSSDDHPAEIEVPALGPAMVRPLSCGYACIITMITMLGMVTMRPAPMHGGRALHKYAVDAWSMVTVGSNVCLGVAAHDPIGQRWLP